MVHLPNKTGPRSGNPLSDFVLQGIATFSSQKPFYLYSHISKELPALSASMLS